MWRQIPRWLPTDPAEGTVVLTGRSSKTDTLHAAGRFHAKLSLMTNPDLSKTGKPMMRQTRPPPMMPIEIHTADGERRAFIEVFELV